jgi:hypothetical protein
VSADQITSVENKARVLGSFLRFTVEIRASVRSFSRPLALGCVCALLLPVLSAPAAAAFELEDSARFVDYLYEELLLRDADAEGATFWQQSLDSGSMAPEDTIRTFLSGDEYLETVAAVARMYRSTVGRLPEFEGAVFWAGELRSGELSLEEIAERFLLSAESIGIYGSAPSDEEFLRTLYQLAHGREPDAEGLAFWTAELAASTRPAVTERISESPEHRSVAFGVIVHADLIRAFLNRGATAAELAAAPEGLDSENIRKYLWQGSSVSIAIIGLGDAVRVTDTSSITMAGRASSLVELDELRWLNSTTGSSGVASGGEEWAALIALQLGDNSLQLTAINRLGAAATQDSQMSYDPNMALYSQLTASRSVAYLDDPTPISFSVGVDPDAQAQLRLLRVSDAGTNDIAEMRDDGLGADQFAADSVFVAEVAPLAAQTGYECYRAQVTDGLGRSYLSEKNCIWVNAHLRNGDVSTALLVAEDVEASFAQANSELTPVQVARAVALELPGKWGIAHSGYTDSASVWWVTAEGILGAYREPEAGTKASAGSSSSIGALPYKPTISDQLYPVAYLADRSRWQPHATGGSGSGLLPAAAGLPSLSGSMRGALVSPFVDDPFVADNSFGAEDDFFGAWNTIKGAGSCALMAAEEAVDSAVTLRNFAQLGSSGYVHLSTHGDQYFEDLAPSWSDSLGPGAFLEGSRGLVLIDAGVALSFNSSGSLDFSDIEDDLVAKRIVLTAGGRLLLTPDFFEYYLPTMPSSLVVLSSCRSAYNGSLANTFLRKGAGAVVGFSDTVNVSYAQATTDSLVTGLLADQTLEEAFAATVQNLGAEDGDATPAFLTIAGDRALKLAQPGFSNGGFERGSAGPWRAQGQSAVVTRLGSVSPAEGLYMGLVSTGLGVEANGGDYQQSACIPPAATQMSFSWNLLSAEYAEYCESGFQDRLDVEVCELDALGATSDCQILLSRQVEEFCNLTTDVGIAFDGNPVEASGWQEAQIDMTGFAGKSVRIRISVSDTLDQVYDTAVLIDALEISSGN